MYYVIGNRYIVSLSKFHSGDHSARLKSALSFQILKKNEVIKRYRRSIHISCWKSGTKSNTERNTTNFAHFNQHDRNHQNKSKMYSEPLLRISSLTSRAQFFVYIPETRAATARRRMQQGSNAAVKCEKWWRSMQKCSWKNLWWY